MRREGEKEGNEERRRGMKEGETEGNEERGRELEK